jgi:hypothetical protein
LGSLISLKKALAHPRYARGHSGSLALRPHVSHSSPTGGGIPQMRGASVGHNWSAAAGMEDSTLACFWRSPRAFTWPTTAILGGHQLSSKCVSYNGACCHCTVMVPTCPGSACLFFCDRGGRRRWTGTWLPGIGSPGSGYPRRDQDTSLRCIGRPFRLAPLSPIRNGQVTWPSRRVATLASAGPRMPSPHGRDADGGYCIEMRRHNSIVRSGLRGEKAHHRCRTVRPSSPSSPFHIPIPCSAAGDGSHQSDPNPGSRAPLPGMWLLMPAVLRYRRSINICLARWSGRTSSPGEWPSFSWAVSGFWTQRILETIGLRFLIVHVLMQFS